MLCSGASTQQLYYIVAYKHTSSKLNPLSKKKKKKSSRVLVKFQVLRDFTVCAQSGAPPPPLLCYDFWVVGFGDVFVRWWFCKRRRRHKSEVSHTLCLILLWLLLLARTEKTVHEMDRLDAGRVKEYNISLLFSFTINEK